MTWGWTSKPLPQLPGDVRRSGRPGSGLENKHRTAWVVFARDPSILDGQAHYRVPGPQLLGSPLIHQPRRRTGLRRCVELQATAQGGLGSIKCRYGTSGVSLENCHVCQINPDCSERAVDISQTSQLVVCMLVRKGNIQRGVRRGEVGPVAVEPVGRRLCTPQTLLLPLTGTKSGFQGPVTQRSPVQRASRGIVEL